MGGWPRSEKSAGHNVEENNPAHQTGTIDSYESVSRTTYTIFSFPNMHSRTQCGPYGAKKRRLMGRDDTRPLVEVAQRPTLQDTQHQLTDMTMTLYDGRFCTTAGLPS